MKKHKRKVIWFNPPFSLNVKTNVGKIFLKLVKRHFPKENPLHKIFNKNMLKVSYSCMGNIASVLSAHNKSILYPKKSEFGCSCRSKTDCPLDNKFLTPKLFTRQIFETILMMRRNFTLRFLKHLSRSVSEITRKNLLIRSIGIALNCQNIYGN